MLNNTNIEIVQLDPITTKKTVIKRSMSRAESTSRLEAAFNEPTLKRMNTESPSKLEASFNEPTLKQTKAKKELISELLQLLDYAA